MIKCKNSKRKIKNKKTVDYPIESELSYLKEIIQTIQIDFISKKHIELKLDVYLMAVEFSLPALTQKGEYDDMGELEYPDIEDDEFNEQIYFKKEFNELKYVSEYTKEGFQFLRHSNF